MNRKRNKYQILVENLVKPESINWAREIKLSKEMYLFCPEQEFWELHFSLPFMLNSLAWLKNGRGAQALREQYSMFKLLEKQKTYNLGEKQEISKGKTKQQNLFEFLDNQNYGTT